MGLTEPAHDTPRSAYRALERRATVAITGLLIALAALAWWATIDAASDMTAMVQGLAQVGAGMPFDMAAPLFLAMWATMIVAMMFPTVAPIVLLHRLVMHRSGRGPGLTAAFSAGYLLVWTAAGVLPLLVLVAFRDATNQAPWVQRAGGMVLLVAGAYQFTGWKETCLRACRQPLTFLLTHHFGQGVPGALRTGASHGMYCLGCCWALMAVLFIVGLMNLVWMAVIAVVFVAEKHSSRSVALTRAVGTVVLLLGVAVVIEPGLLTSISGTPSMPAGQ
jgi:predicted metal-binding membrane protein